MVIKKLDELAEWSNYRKQMVENLRSVTEDTPIFISVDDFDFDLRGSKWPGRVVLFGTKGNATMMALKKEGLQFRTGTCGLDEDGTTVSVEGLSKSLLKAANKTLNKLSVGYSLELATEQDGTEDEEEGDDPEDDADDDPEGDGQEAARAPNLGATQGAGQGAARRPNRDATRRAEADNDIEDEPELEGVDDAAVADTQAQAKLQKKSLYKRVQTIIANQTELRRPIGVLVRKADVHEKAQEHEAQMAVYEEIEELITSDEGAEAEADNGVDIREWAQYRLFVRGRLRNVDTSADAQEPFFVSRKKFEFSVDGKPWRGNAVLAGVKSRALVQRLKQEGTTFLEGTCYQRSGEKALVVESVSGAARKAAAKTLKMLRLGYRIDGEDGGDGQEDQEGQEGEEQTASDTANDAGAAAGDGAPTSAAGQRPQRARPEQAQGQFAAAEQVARASLARLHQELAALDGEADAADTLKTRVEALLDRIRGLLAPTRQAANNQRTPNNSGARQAIDGAIRELNADPVLAHVESNQWGIRIRGPLLQALTRIRDAMATS